MVATARGESNEIFFGAGAPDAGLGSLDDWYIDDASGDWYHKEVAGWISRFRAVGQDSGGNASIDGNFTLTQGQLIQNGTLARVDQTGLLTAATVGYRTRVIGDTQYRFTISADGTLKWGDGATATDVTLARNAAGFLTVTGQLNTTSSINASGRITVTRAAGNINYDSRVTGDVNPRWTVDTNGQMAWGDGTAATDTFLYRSGAGVLQLTGRFAVTRSLASDLIFSNTVTGDAFSRFFMDGNAAMKWGPGNTTTDTTLRRRSNGELSLQNSYLSAERSAVALRAFSTVITGDSQFRFDILSEGKLQWSDGTNAADAIIFRNSAGELRTTDTMLAAVRNAAGSSALSAHVTGDVQRRFSIRADGQHSWGDGTSSADAQMYRRGVKEIGFSDTFLTVQRVNATDLAYRSLLSAGDTVARFSIDVSGKASWGDGTNPADTFLSRIGTAVLGIPTLEHSAVDFSTGIRLKSTTAGSVRSTNLIFTDNQAVPTPITVRKEAAQMLAFMDSTGIASFLFDVGNDKIFFGSAADVSLYRFGANILGLGTSTQAGRFLVTQSAIGNPTFSSRVTTDTNDRLSIMGDGTMTWGSGNAAGDVTITRPSAGVLRMTAGRLDLQGVATNTITLGTLVSGDAAIRLQIQADGQLRFGSGAGSADVAFGRIGNGVVGLMQAGTGLTTILQIPSTGTTVSAGEIIGFAVGVGTGRTMHQVSYDASASSFIGHNVYRVPGGVATWGATHATFGSRAIELKFGGYGFRFFADGLATTSGAAATLTERFRVQDDGSVIIGGAATGIPVGLVPASVPGQGVIWIGNAGVVPTTNPTNAGVAYVEAGVLKYRDTVGNISVLGGATMSSTAGFALTGSGSYSAPAQTAVGTVTYKSRVVADTQDRFTVTADGAMAWGSGAAAADVNLARTTAQRLQLGNGVLANSFQIINPAAGDIAIMARANADTQNRIQIYTDGGIWFGPGNGALDTLVQRAGVGIFKAAQAFHVGGDFRHLGANVGFFNAAQVAKQTIAGSRGGNAAVASIIAALVAYGLAIDTTTA